ncbi:hypothetical protein AQUCO_02700107v1 [Aquilegia coerulea]|uniref:RING-type domain-containing protein n=1 Tax=Aquilegia coerulea TaxID=218851 RepID=A0A2G5D578_AQUCA|nr:hypothetical protein AQUCO_02700107v1 [Aquilegia coerulea]
MRWLIKEPKIRTVVDQVCLLEQKFDSCRPIYQGGENIKFAFRLAQDEIDSQITRSAESCRAMNLKETCSICLEDTDVAQMLVVDGCLHCYCQSCLRQHVEVKLRLGMLPRCPHEGCDAKLDIPMCKKVLSPEWIDIMNRRIKESSIRVTERVYCPYPRCSELMSKSEVLPFIGIKLSQSSIKKCIKCHGLFCIDCKVPWHLNMSCREYKSLNPDPNAYATLKALATNRSWRQWVLSLDSTVLFTFTNNCSQAIWPATLAGGGQPQLSTTGFKLSPGESKTISAALPWSGRLWARTHCSYNPSRKFACATADCGSGQMECNGAGAIAPATLVQFYLSAHLEGDLDNYSISLVDGYNLPVGVIPRATWCSNETSPSCTTDINKTCPPELMVKQPGGSDVIGCKSACAAFKDPKYCCTKPYNTQRTCRPNMYSRIFKKACPLAVTYALDDKTSRTAACMAASEYIITFCPPKGF